MNRDKTDITIHPKGESEMKETTKVELDTFGGKLHVEWDPQAAVTPMGQLSFFVEYLKTAELLDPWVEECPLTYTSPNSPGKRNVLGTLLLSILAGHKRYAQITAIRMDTVNPELLGMDKVVSEDCVRRAFIHEDANFCTKWQLNHLQRCWEPLLYEPWILDGETIVWPPRGSGNRLQPQETRPSFACISYLYDCESAFTIGCRSATWQSKCLLIHPAPPL